MAGHCDSAGFPNRHHHVIHPNRSKSPGNALMDDSGARPPLRWGGRFIHHWNLDLIRCFMGGEQHYNSQGRWGGQLPGNAQMGENEKSIKRRGITENNIDEYPLAKRAWHTVLLTSPWAPSLSGRKMCSGALLVGTCVCSLWITLTIFTACR